MTTTTQGQQNGQVRTVDHPLDVPDAGITLQTIYSFSEDFGNWKVTDNKAIDIEMSVVHSDAEEIFVEHMHSDVYIESKKITYDGLLQDTMDDSYHGTGYPGFYIDTTYSYYETFSIEGRNPNFMSELEFHCFHYYGTGSCSSENVPISEERIRSNDKHDGGVYGQTIYFVYDVLIRYSGEDVFHKVIVSDNIFIDLESNSIVDNRRDVADVSATDEAPFPFISLLVGGLMLAVMFTILDLMRRRRL